MGMCARAVAFVLVSLGLAAQTAEAAARPRLVVFIVVDQLGAAIVERHEALLSDGFRTLSQRGRLYLGIRMAHANTETAPGHATLLTGAWPSTHGIVANSWFDAEGKKTYCVG